jgi:hypothetical protein
MKSFIKISIALAIFATSSVSGAWFGNSNQSGGYYNPSYRDQSVRGSGNCPQCSNNNINSYAPGWWGSLGSSLGFIGDTTTYTYPTVSGTDRDIAERVRAALEKKQTLTNGARGIQVSVENGKVTLTGSVKSNSEKSLAQTTARNVSGVTTVNNQLAVTKQ